MTRALLFALPFACSTLTLAEPRVQSAEECGIAADMAIVARSLAQEEVHDAKAATIMERIYNVSGSERGTALMKDILSAAYRKDASVTSRTFAEELFMTCMKTGGNLELVLGKRL